MSDAASKTMTDKDKYFPHGVVLLKKPPKLKIFITSLIYFSFAGTHYHLHMHYIVSNSNN